MVPLVAQTGTNRPAGKHEVWGLEVAALLPGPEVRRIAPCGSIEKTPVILAATAPLTLHFSQ